MQEKKWEKEREDWERGLTFVVFWMCGGWEVYIVVLGEEKKERGDIGALIEIYHNLHDFWT